MPDYYEFSKSYLSGRFFRTKVGRQVSIFCEIEPGVRQGKALGPIVFIIYTHNIPTCNDTLIKTFAGVAVITAADSNPIETSKILQEHLHAIELWFNKWRIKFNENKSSHITFMLKKG